MTKFPRLEVLLNTANTFILYNKLDREKLLLLLPLLRWVKTEDTIDLFESSYGKKVSDENKEKWKEHYRKRATELEMELVLIPLDLFNSLILKLSINKSKNSEWDIARIIKDGFAEIRALSSLKTENKGDIIALEAEGMPDFAVISSSQQLLELVEVKLCHFSIEAEQIFRSYIFSIKDMYVRGGYPLILMAECFAYNLCNNIECRIDKFLTSGASQAIILNFIKKVLMNLDEEINLNLPACKNCGRSQSIFYRGHLGLATLLDPKFVNKDLKGLENKICTTIEKATKQLYVPVIKLDANNEIKPSCKLPRRLIYFAAADTRQEFYRPNIYQEMVRQFYYCADKNRMEMKMSAATWLVDWWLI